MLCTTQPPTFSRPLPALMVLYITTQQHSLVCKLSLQVLIHNVNAFTPLYTLVKCNTKSCDTELKRANFLSTQPNASWNFVGKTEIVKNSKKFRRIGSVYIAHASCSQDATSVETSCSYIHIRISIFEDRAYASHSKTTET